MIECPHCGELITGMHVQEGRVGEREGHSGLWQSVTALCPVCDSAVHACRHFYGVHETATAYTDRVTRNIFRERLGLAVATKLVTREDC